MSQHFENEARLSAEREGAKSVCRDLRDRADKLDASLRDVLHSKTGRMSLMVAAHVLRVAIEQNLARHGIAPGDL